LAFMDSAYGSSSRSGFLYLAAFMFAFMICTKLNWLFYLSSSLLLVLRQVFLSKEEPSRVGLAARGPSTRPTNKMHIGPRR